MLLNKLKFRQYMAVGCILLNCLVLSSCDIKLVESTDAGTSPVETSEPLVSEAAPQTQDNSWQTETFASFLPEISVETTEPTEISTEAAETTVSVVSEKEEITETVPEFISSFDATVLTAERKYVIVKPKIGSDEFEISRKIIVYCPQSVDLEEGDSATVSYSGEFDTYEGDLPVISNADCVKTSGGNNIPDFISETKIVEVEVIRVYADGFLGKVTKDANDFTEGDKINIDVSTSEAENIVKGQIIEVRYKRNPVFSDDDYPSIDADDCKVTFTPSFIFGSVVSINNKGIVLSFEDGSFNAARESDIIIISNIFSDVEEGDMLKVIYEDDISEEPYIIYSVKSYEKEER